MLSGAQRVHDPTLLTERAKLHEIGKITCCIIFFNLFAPGYFVVEGFFGVLSLFKCALNFTVSFCLSLHQLKSQI